MASKTKSKPVSFVWTGDEVELLLNVTLQYKVKRNQENVDWESCYTKYADISNEFKEQYPDKEASIEGKEFPHSKDSVSKLIIATKLKNIRAKYRLAVDSGRRSGHGSVVLLFFELCEQIWGASPATGGIPTGIESTDIKVNETSSSSSVDPPDTGHDSDGVSVDGNATAGVSASVVNERRTVLQAKLYGYRHEKLKRRGLVDTIAQEELELKRSMLSLMERAERQNMENLNKMTANIAQLTASITNGFNVLTQMIQPPIQPPPYTQPQKEESAVIKEEPGWENS